MTFLQPLLLLALPLMALPIVIHLINQNRHRTVHWAATRFLLQARRMTRGIARLKYWLILLARTLAIAGLILAVSRPMAGGWLGWTTGSVPDLTIIVLDRSVSMEEEVPVTASDTGGMDASGAPRIRTGISRRAAALQKLTTLLTDLERTSGVLLFDACGGGHRMITSPGDLLDIPETQASAMTSDIPGTLRSVADYIATHQPGRTDIWICSDLQKHDWNPGSGHWPQLRAELKESSGVRCYLINYRGFSATNFSIRASGVHRRDHPDGSELVMDLQIEGVPQDGVQGADPTESLRMPLTFLINGARSVQELPLTGNRLIRNGHTIPIDRDTPQGWGSVELPHDTNTADNSWKFVYGESTGKKSLIVADDSEVGEMLRIACSAAPDGRSADTARVVSADQLADTDWHDVSLVLWQAPLPVGDVASQLESFVAAGGSLICFPPEHPGTQQLLGARWTAWTGADGSSGALVARWKTDDDLLANVRSGAPLPVGQLKIYQHCGLESDKAIAIAVLDGGHALLNRLQTDQGAVWFCSTLPKAAYSSLVTDGITFYIMIQRALARGAASTGSAQQQECRPRDAQVTARWKPLDDLSRNVPVSGRAEREGLYQLDTTLLAINRPEAEDQREALLPEVLEQLLAGLEWQQIDGQALGDDTLASEVWRIFLTLMIAALLAEAVLCVPETHAEKQAVTAG